MRLEARLLLSPVFNTEWCKVGQKCATGNPEWVALHKVWGNEQNSPGKKMLGLQCEKMVRVEPAR